MGCSIVILKNRLFVFGFAIYIGLMLALECASVMICALNTDMGSVSNREIRIYCKFDPTMIYETQQSTRIYTAIPI